MLPYVQDKIHFYPEVIRSIFKFDIQRTVHRDTFL